MVSNEVVIKNLFSAFVVSFLGFASDVTQWNHDWIEWLPSVTAAERSRLIHVAGCWPTYSRRMERRNANLFLAHSCNLCSIDWIPCRPFLMQIMQSQRFLLVVTVYLLFLWSFFSSDISNFTQLSHCSLNQNLRFSSLSLSQDYFLFSFILIFEIISLTHCKAF